MKSKTFEAKQTSAERPQRDFSSVRLEQPKASQNRAEQTVQFKGLAITTSRYFLS